MTEKVHTIVLEDEFRTCPMCGYQDGFHTMLQRDKVSDLGACPRIEIFSQIEAFGKFYHRHIVDIPRIQFFK